MASDPPGLDLDRLGAYLEARGLTCGPLIGEVIQGGKSNLTYIVRDQAKTFVVRRPPLGHVLATAHDMAREYRVISALRDTDVPVPRTFHLCEDADVIGASFYVMDYVEGGRPPLTRRLARDLTGVLAALHSVEPAAVGLGDFGRPDGFLQRQVGRWKRQLDASRSREVPGIDDLFARLARAVPGSESANHKKAAQGKPAIVHGDYKLGNTLIKDGVVRAIVDWEMSTIGDPLTDLALFLLYGEFAALDGDDSAEALDVAELAQHYATTSGRDVSKLGWYVGLACFKLAVIAEGIHFRYIQGLTVGEGFAEVGEQVAPLVARGLMEV